MLAKLASITRPLLPCRVSRRNYYYYYHVLFEVSEVVAFHAIYDSRAAVSIGERKQRFTCIDWCDTQTERA